ncbi:MAG: Alpha-L-fucosidase, family [Bacteroidota bacterium]|jgi:alpha-L-fucosidase 2
MIRFNSILRILWLFGSLVFVTMPVISQHLSAEYIDKKLFNPTTFLWYKEPASKWEDAMPVGNGRLGAMVYGRHGKEEIQLNEDTYWSGGPYSTVVKGGASKLPEIQKLIFEGKPLEAHKLFGRYMMGYPVEQQKYQSLGNIQLVMDEENEVKDYKRWLDLSTGVTTVSYKNKGIQYVREVFASVPHNAIFIRISADKPNSISFETELRGVRNPAHSNYGTDYFRMDTFQHNALKLTGKSTDYMGVEGKIRYEARLRVLNEGGTLSQSTQKIKIEKANSVTLVLIAGTNFINYKDVSGDVSSLLDAMETVWSNIPFENIKKKAIEEHQRLFNRVSISLPSSENSYLPTNERISRMDSLSDPSLAALCYQFGRYLLISSSRPGTQPANLQGIWNQDMNPSWDSKYTTNINTQMNYWAVESANLSECLEPFTKMVEELTDQGGQVARESYGANGWVMHQNTDIWRVAAPMDGPTWGTFSVGGAWLTTHLWEHYLYTLDSLYLERIYPVMKGAVDFFMDFLVEYPNGKGWLVTNPSNSPENPPKGEGYSYFYDEVTGMYYFTTICAGATMDIQILKDLFSYFLKATNILKKDLLYAQKVKLALEKLVPTLVGKEGNLQEWTEDYGQLEDKHRHFSHLYGLYPGNVLSAKNTPQFIKPIKAVLNQRGDGGTGFSRAWKMALYARLYDGNKANDIFKGYIKEQCYASLFAKCGKPLQVDGSLGLTAAVTEMLMQSHEGVIHLLPALPDEWKNGEIKGVKARGGFELSFKWANNKLVQVDILSLKGEVCNIQYTGAAVLLLNKKEIALKKKDQDVFSMNTIAGKNYQLIFN